MKSPTSDFRLPTSGRRGRPPIQDEFTDRRDLSSAQKYQLRHRGDSVGTLRERIARTDLGLALLSLVAQPGVPLTQQDIAAWCGCTRSNIYNIEQSALKKLRNALFFRDRETCEALRDHLTHDRQPARARSSERIAA